MEKVRPGFAFLFVAQIWRLGSPEKPCRHVQFQPFGSGWWGEPELSFSELQCYMSAMFCGYEYTPPVSSIYQVGWMIQDEGRFKKAEHASIWETDRKQKTMSNDANVQV